jgi:hypothetical protein
MKSTSYQRSEHSFRNQPSESSRAQSRPKGRAHEVHGLRSELPFTYWDWRAVSRQINQRAESHNEADER